METTSNNFHLITTLRSALANLLSSGELADLVLAVILIVATAIIARLVTSLLRHFLQRENSPLPQSSIFINICRVGVWGVGISVTLSSCFGIDVTGIIAALGVGGIAISLGMKDTISNLIDGLQMSLMKTVVPGDHIEISGRKGIVRDITWRQMTIETSNAQTIIVPNTVINNGVLVKLPPMEKIIVPVSLYKNLPDINQTIHDIEVEVKEELSRKYTVTKDPVTQITSIAEASYVGSLVVWLDPKNLTYAQTDDAKDIVSRVVAMHSPLID